MNETLTDWPERPTCHDTTWEGQQYPDLKREWRAPELNRRNKEPYGYPFRTCWFDGSMHPEDLLRWLGDGARLHGSDWKYGFPHKFYVDVPNPKAGKIVCLGGSSQPTEPTDEERERFQNWRFVDEYKTGTKRWVGDLMSPAPEFTTAKFYTVHFEELSDAAFALLAPVVSEHSGIEFLRDDDGRIKYRAPNYGYQR